MRYARELVTSTVVGGLFVVAPIYLAVLLLLKAMASVASLVEPLSALFPGSIIAQELFSLVLVLVVCFLVGMAIADANWARDSRARRECVPRKTSRVQPAEKSDAATSGRQ